MSPTPYRKLKVRIREVAEKKGFANAAQLAAAAHCAISTVRMVWLSDERLPTGEVLEKIANALKVRNISELLVLVEDQQKSE